ncbi:MAG: GNAT family N-acetyltransferase [Epsilonproteobacteria bacterium]|nr:GNAT family N-acetyltransferase [Campylobacterota bacterium]
MKVVYDVLPYIDDLMNLYKKEWWTKSRTKEEVIEMLKNTPVTIGIVENNKLIAFARVLSDFVYKALIFDVIVDIKYRNKGISKMLMHEILKHSKLKNVKSFELYCKDEMKSYYEKFGFSQSNLALMKKNYVNLY